MARLTALVILALIISCAVGKAESSFHKREQGGQGASNHTSNWAVLVDTSKFWLNYRHGSNALSFYRTIKRLGIPDSNIILMLADDMACNPRNPYPATIFNDASHALNLYDSTVEVDYRGSEVTVENFLRLLMGRHEPAAPRSKRLLSDQGSNIFVFLTGHGGDDFIKIQDVQELMGQDLADALQQMHEKQRYNELLLMVETCEAATLIEKITAPGVIATASSVRGESSFSYLNDFLLGQPVVDRFTWLTLEFCEKVDISSTAVLPDLFKVYSYDMMDSTFSYRELGLSRPLSSMKLTDFMGSVARVSPGREEYHFNGTAAAGCARELGATPGDEREGLPNVASNARPTALAAAATGAAAAMFWELHVTGGLQQQQQQQPVPQHGAKTALHPPLLPPLRQHVLQSSGLTGAGYAWAGAWAWLIVHGGPAAAVACLLAFVLLMVLAEHRLRH